MEPAKFIGNELKLGVIIADFRFRKTDTMVSDYDVQTTEASQVFNLTD